MQQSTTLKRGAVRKLGAWFLLLVDQVTMGVVLVCCTLFCPCITEYVLLMPLLLLLLLTYSQYYK